ncbi:hypothetical protein [Aureimonas psammosilenae]|uniref:hypothetical protein n=1 Tax=Aureimonas psammosilenae TaxID=2495496 RepID=UPI00126084D7|nr:hypothetical protein [Aureimonas psammosilenae]
MIKSLVSIRITSRSLGMDLVEELVVGPESDPNRIGGFVRDAFGVPFGLRSSSSVAHDGTRTDVSQVPCGLDRYPELTVVVADGAADPRQATSGRSFDASVLRMVGRYQDAVRERLPPGPIAYKTIDATRHHPFNVLVNAHGRIYVRFGFSKLQHDRDAYVEVRDAVADEHGEIVEEAQLILHPEALTRTCDQTWGGLRVGSHHIPAGRLFAGQVERTCRGYDLDTIDEIVARILDVWGDLDVQMNIAPSRLYRRSSAMQAAA